MREGGRQLLLMDCVCMCGKGEQGIEANSLSLGNINNEQTVTVATYSVPSPHLSTSNLPASFTRPTGSVPFIVPSTK